MFKGKNKDLYNTELSTCERISKDQDYSSIDSEHSGRERGRGERPAT